MLNKLLYFEDESIIFFRFHPRINPDRTNWSPLPVPHSAAAFVYQVKAPIKKSSEEMGQDSNI